MNGRLSAVDVAAANTAETVYEAPADIQYASVNISVCNRGPDTAQITISGSTVTNTIDVANIIEFATELLPHNVLVRTGVIVPTGEFLVVESNTDDVSVVVMGAEVPQ
jgi:hypothetical protein